MFRLILLIQACIMALLPFWSAEILIVGSAVRGAKYKQGESKATRTSRTRVRKLCVD
jgi:hypothetical protein